MPSGIARVGPGSIPFLAPRDHGIDDADELAHASGERNLWLLSLGDQAIIEGLEYGIVPCRGSETSHVEEIAKLAATAFDVTVAPPLAAVVVIRCNSQQRGSDLVAHLAEFRHGCDQSSGGRLAESRNALDDRGEFRKMGCGLDHGCDRGFEFDNFAGDLLQEPGLHFLHDVRGGMLTPVSQAGLHVEQVLTRIHDLHQLVTCRIAGLARRLDKDLGEPGDHQRIDRIVLGEPPGRLGEAAYPAWDQRPGLRCRPPVAPWPSPARNRRKPPWLPCRPCACEASGSERAAPPWYLGKSAVATTSECMHPPCPWPRRYRRQRDRFVPSSTPFLARFGLKARATVRVEEDTGSVSRSPTGSQGL